jgi:hypothetical protein
MIFNYVALKKLALLVFSVLFCFVHFDRHDKDLLPHPISLHSFSIFEFIKFIAAERFTHLGKLNFPNVVWL